MNGYDVILEPGNPYDLTDEELDELEHAITEEFPDLTVQTIRRPERGYGVTFNEVIHVWLTATDYVSHTVETAGVFTAAIHFARRRWKRDRDEHPGERPRRRSVILWGPDGKHIKSVLIDEPEGEPVADQPFDDTPRRRPDID